MVTPPLPSDCQTTRFPSATRRNDIFTIAILILMLILPLSRRRGSRRPHGSPAAAAADEC
eukprot:CAMPEP_0194752532 /NCGR_PEP_ID=MMETSP0323_2-20130528/6343_1 /TAXON_ID=2866 ORGANISM="Crypthecodinium cohnii, Strain Seligo" /NCGR_SAMPLE_ID=MMETSP0323_2 /ASSEMBLY_ACC=CAM_ASM_000346 /LENGTH=59 /DNA_ID=CAMNT_0039669543 /DNA_START=154 /DNA_END=333 /DNA_ORIENTATION=+